MLISIVTPTLNARSYIADCIDSVQAQRSDRGVIEHLIVDGGSTDGTADYAERRGVRVLRGRDSGIFDAVNRGSRAAAGRWLGFLGADDVLLDGALAAIASTAERTEARWLTGSVRYLDRSGSSMGRLQPPPRWVPPAMFACLGWSAIHHIATYLRRDFFEELGGFDLEYRVAGDYDLFCRAAALSSCERIERPLAAMRRTGENFSVKRNDMGRRECAAIRARYGPQSLYRQSIYRQIVRVWVNAANPTWSVRKVFGKPY